MSNRFNISAQLRPEMIPDANFGSVTGNYSLAALDDALLYDVSAGSGTLSLTAISGQNGREIVVIKSDSSTNTGTISAYSGDTINGSATYVLYNQYQAVLLRATAGTGWLIVATFNAPTTPNPSTQIGICKTAATTNIASLSGSTTVDGQGLTTGDPVLLTGQTTGSQNGPWIVASGSWARPGWYATAATIQPGAYIEVYNGSSNGPAIYYLKSSTAITVDTTSTTWVDPSGSGSGTVDAGTTGQYAIYASGGTTVSGSSPAIDQPLTGTVNNSNTNFTLPATPVAGYAIYRDGARCHLNATGTFGFTASGTAITFNQAPEHWAACDIW